MNSNNELNHSLKGSIRAGHKYISRTMKNGKWRYKYAKAANAGKAKMNKLRQKIDDLITTPSESGTRDAADVITKGPYTEIRPGVKIKQTDVYDNGRHRRTADSAAYEMQEASSKARQLYANKKLDEYAHGKISKKEMQKILADTDTDNFYNKQKVEDIDRVQRKGREIVEKWKNRKKK